MLQRFFNGGSDPAPTSPPTSPSEVDSPIRVMLYQDIGDKRKLVLFDSAMQETFESHKSRTSSATSSVSSSSKLSTTSSIRKVLIIFSWLKIKSAHTDLIGDMIFGTVPMLSQSDSTTKLHQFSNPTPHILLSKLFTVVNDNEDNNADTTHHSQRLLRNSIMNPSFFQPNSPLSTPTNAGKIFI